MTDRELLEAAAKAAGIEVKPHGNHKHSPDLVFIHKSKNWNPLTDDGDALRLLTKLNLQIQIVPGWAVAYAGSVASKQFSERRHDSDPYAATRRAIVRAAAEIGSKL